jgi:hypothetical protein
MHAVIPQIERKRILNTPRIGPRAGLLSFDRRSNALGSTARSSTSPHERCNETEANVMAATQRPICGSVFTALVKQAAWKSISSWYLVTQDDRAINPELERFFARTDWVTTVEIKANHVPFISHSQEVARRIERRLAQR